MSEVFTGYLPEACLSQEDARKLGVQIHPMAQVARGAELSAGCIIGPGAMVGPKVVLGKNVCIGASAVVRGRVRIGDDTHIYPFATIGSAPQDLKYAGEDTTVEIGARNRIREYVNISLGTQGGGGLTSLGDDNLLMVYTHLGHDCKIGNHCIFANGVQLAGHVEVGNNVVFGGLSAAHQFSHFGDYAMIAGGGMCSQDVPPFCMVHGNHAQINGLNVVGLRRGGFKNVSEIKAMYRIVYQEQLTLENAIARIESDVPSSPERKVFVDFLRASTRGIVR